MKRRTVWLATFVLLAACADEAPEIPEFEGRWEGTMDSGISVSVTSSENQDGEISGSGVLSAGAESIAITFDGVHSHPDVSFTASATGFDDFNFGGEFTDDETVPGILQGSGFGGDSVTLRRQ